MIQNSAKALPAEYSPAPSWVSSCLGLVRKAYAVREPAWEGDGLVEQQHNEEKQQQTDNRGRSTTKRNAHRQACRGEPREGSITNTKQPATTFFFAGTNVQLGTLWGVLEVTKAARIGVVIASKRVRVKMLGSSLPSEMQRYKK